MAGPIDDDADDFPPQKPFHDRGPRERTPNYNQHQQPQPYIPQQAFPQTQQPHQPGPSPLQMASRSMPANKSNLPLRKAIETNTPPPLVQLAKRPRAHNGRNWRLAWASGSLERKRFPTALCRTNSRNPKKAY